MTTRDGVIGALRMARFVGALGMLGVVVAGALGYGDSVKLLLAAGGMATAVALKVSHIVV